MKKLLLAPVCLTVVAFAVTATNMPTPSQANEGASAGQPATLDEVLPQLDGVVGDDIEAAAGADVITGNMATPAVWGNVVVGPDTFRGYSIGTTSCNIGTVPLNWIQNSTNHPVIAQNLYRISGTGRFEQIGVGWLKHSFCALQNAGGLPNGFCSSCTPTCGGCCSSLGIGCWDPYTSARNGDQTMLGPRFEVNAFTGVFPWPHTARGVTGNAIFKRVQVNINDLNPALNTGAVWYVETQYVARDDALAGNHFNNASSRQVAVTGAAPNFGLGMTGTFNTTIPAIDRWSTHAAGAIVNLVPVPGEGHLRAGVYVRDNGDGTWTYNYAVHNLNSDRSVYSIEVPVPSGVTISNIGMSFPKYHSGEPFTNGAWTGTNTGSSVRWTADNTFAGNPNANAIRWGTAYSFYYTANTAPQGASVTLETFKVAGSVATSLQGPSAPAILIGDLNCDGVVSVGDIAAMVMALTDPSGYAATFPGCNILAGDCSADGATTVGDIGCFVDLLTGG